MHTPLITPTDRIVIRICALCVLGAKKEEYEALISRLPEAEMAALLDLLQVKSITIAELVDSVFQKDWKPSLQERAHLVNNTTLFLELGLA